MPRRDLTRVVVLSTFVLAAACSRRSLVADGGVRITRDAGDVSDAVFVTDGRAFDTGATDAPSAIDVRPAIDVPSAIDVPPGVDAPGDDGASRVCPLPAPSTGQSCSGRPSGMLCFYGDAEPSVCSIRCECRGQSWICDRPCATDTCSGFSPIPASSCLVPNLRCTYATGCAPRELMCMTFEVGAPGTWVCVSGCGPCDAGMDGPLDGGVDAVADVARDAIADAGGGIPCGVGLTCSGTDICVTLNLCGGPVDCRDMPDGGECPAGSKLYPDCPGGRPGCIPDCPGPSYRCVPRPAACGAALSCGCVTADICPFTSCISAQGRNVFCANS
jgi:hypothetical protein